MDIKSEINLRAEAIEELLKKYLPAEEGYQKQIMEAMNYSILAGGKRLRPMLMQETYRLFGGQSKVIEPFMAAMEMIHTYSLVHDDLPAMDNDEYRRGKIRRPYVWFCADRSSDGRCRGCRNVYQQQNLPAFNGGCNRTWTRFSACMRNKSRRKKI